MVKYLVLLLLFVIGGYQFPYPYAGEIYQGWTSDGPDDAYNATWTEDGRLWQPNLPEVGRRTHWVLAEIVKGRYIFNAVVCESWLVSEPGEFEVKETTEMPIICEGGPSSGFEIIALEWGYRQYLPGITN